MSLVTAQHSLDSLRSLLPLLLHSTARREPTKTIKQSPVESAESYRETPLLVLQLTRPFLLSAWLHYVSTL
ncbi:hypothetical protein ACOSP7_008570 [Xanthoceras sorbifolium]